MTSGKEVVHDASHLVTGSVVETPLAAPVAAMYSDSESNNALKVPPNSVLVKPLSFAVLGSSGAFRTGIQAFNPTHTKPPFFQIFDEAFLDVIGPSPAIRVIAEDDTFAFAHEAPVWIPSTDDVFFASNAGGPLGRSDMKHNNQVSRINLKYVDAASGGLVDVMKVPLSDDIQMTNGGTPFRGSLLFANSGRGELPPSLALVQTSPPFTSKILLDNFFGRQFNSLNDLKIHPTSKAIFFTDVEYGWLCKFRPAPLLPNQVYRFNADTGELRVVADGFRRCNGIAFSPDGKTAYITDTGAAGGFLGFVQTDPATIYAFDVDPHSQAFTNKRVFAYVDSGVPDGIQLDTAGNVYSGCGDGVQVWNPTGTLIGKIFLGTTSANMAFAGEGRLVILAETKIFLANIAATGVDLEL